MEQTENLRWFGSAMWRPAPRTRFLILFFAILLASFALVAWRPINDQVIVPYTSAIATVANGLLRFLGQDTTASGTIIASPSFAVDVKNGCNGVEAMLILIAAMSAFPASFRSKLRGIVAGSLVIQILNLVRIVTLYLLGKYRPELFEIFHNAIWQVVIVLVALGIFLAWSRRVVAIESPEVAA